MMRSLAVDFGGVTIGLAIGESDSQIASPRNSLRASGTLKKDAEAILQALRGEEAEEIVLGVALSEGQDTRMSLVTRKLGRILQDLGAVVHYVDESLTSYESETVMKELGMKGSQRRKAVDSESACRILERYWGGMRG
ncbi:MAG: Holliday junction resolvase RuvX [Fimbriimonadaceae bacterium]|jgi:putative transcription antitermination factor YqgF|nr:Holliday junction resolvase RuvX [Fimbriimonadaceae bacterium]